MALRSVDIHPKALGELKAAFRWYATRDFSAAQRFRAALNHVFYRIATSAELGVNYGQYYRWMRLKRFPYVVYFEIRDPHPVLIYAMAHGRRRLGYWLRRTQP